MTGVPSFMSCARTSPASNSALSTTRLPAGVIGVVAPAIP